MVELLRTYDVSTDESRGAGIVDPDTLDSLSG